MALARIRRKEELVMASLSYLKRVEMWILSGWSLKHC
jgi:hypothetical protein